MTKTKTTGLEILTTSEMARADAWAIKHGVPGVALMERAGRAVVDALVQRWQPRRVLVLCGPGNNGGDGHVVARVLSERGWPVRLASLVPVDALTGDALFHARLWQARPSPAGQVELVTGAALAEADLVVDALFGAGLSRGLEGPAGAVLRLAAERGLPIVAVDVPSGVMGDTGQAIGAVASTLTVTFFRQKPAHVLMPGRQLCGERVVADIGIDPAALAAVCPSVHENDPVLWRGQWPTLAHDSHKYRRGHALVFGGRRMTGAARLSAYAAARVGAGLCTVAMPQAVWPVYASALTSVMAYPLNDVDGPALLASWTAAIDGAAPLRWSAMALGPGGAIGLPGDDAGRTMRELVLSALQVRAGRSVVLDADALTAFEGDAAALFGAICGAPGPVVMTPHEGEFGRLFDTGVDSKLSRARRAAQCSGAVMLLKGPDTVIASPDGRVVVNTHAPSSLATAGSGDVLTGLIVGLLAQGMPAFEAACAAAWLHGDCAAAFGPGLIADDLIDQVPAALSRLASR